MKPTQPILIVEDNEDEQIFLKKAFALAEISNPVQIVSDGQEALEYLEGVGSYADRLAYPVPGIVLLDLKLPRISGFEILERLRRSRDLRSLIAIVMSSSNRTTDVQRAYELGANAYLVKPGSFDELLRFMKVFKSYWLEVNNAAPTGA